MDLRRSDAHCRSSVPVFSDVVFEEVAGEEDNRSRMYVCNVEILNLKNEAMGEIFVRNEADMKRVISSFAGQMTFVFATMRVGCRPCTAIAPTYTRLANEITAQTNQILFLKFDVTEATDLAGHSRYRQRRPFSVSSKTPKKID